MPPGLRPNAKVFVAGSRGMVGSAIVRALQKNGWLNLLVPSRQELELTRQDRVEKYFEENRPDVVFVAAAMVGGIRANTTFRAKFITTNLQIETNVIDTAWRTGVAKLIFLASSCIYPRNCPQPMKEEALWTGRLEPTNSPYAVAKLAGIEMCLAYRDQYNADFTSVIPCNLYGPNDSYHPENSHLIAAIISKIHRAKELRNAKVEFWGTGNPRREVMYVDDLADACFKLMVGPSLRGPVNIGFGEDFTIRDLVSEVARLIGFDGEIAFDGVSADGVPQKLLDSARMHAYGWRPRVGLREGLRLAYEDFKRRYDELTGTA